ncbi:MAG TPA: rRNA maturation RNase YbeY [Planctomycetaceae bacterium]|jgi:probable rRNA maturation factor|nr:rRNA maturation RNase YbeY [Planctomycetaceae bacterium]
MTRPQGSVRRRAAAAGQAPRNKSRRGGGKKGPPPGRSKTTYAVDVRDEQAHLRIPAARIRQIVRHTLAAEKLAAATISVALVDNRAIHDLNRRHLKHDYETDVLSFLFDAEPEFAASSTGPRGKGRRIDGEIVISAEMAVQSASQFDWSPAEELTLYLVHGLLHLCGYDDLTEPERRLMRRRERAILKLLGD